MTGYNIEIGYNGYHRTDYDEMWEELKRVALETAGNPQRIVDEARRLGAPETCEDEDCDCNLNTYADYYAKPLGTFGHPLEIFDDGKDNRWIMQYATTGPDIKYLVRRAYVRLVIEEMHRRGIEVNLIVS